MKWFALLLVCLFASVAEAGHCHNRQQIVAQYVAPVVNYFIGAPLRAAAIVEAEKRTDPEWSEFQQYKAFKETLRQEQQAEQEPEPPQSIIVQTCAKCHSGPTPKGELLLDGSVPLSGDQTVMSMRRVRDGSMPPKSTLSPEVVGDIISEFLDLKGE